jgi:hypothetical protein
MLSLYNILQKYRGFIKSIKPSLPPMKDDRVFQEKINQAKEIVERHGIPKRVSVK